MFTRTIGRIFSNTRAIFQRINVRGIATASKELSNRNTRTVPSAMAVAAGIGVAGYSFFSNNAENARVPVHGIPGTINERTFIAIKPDGVQRKLIGKIIQRFEEKGYTLVAMKLIQPTETMAAGHYDDLKSKPFFRGLVAFFSSGPVIAMVWQGKDAIKTGRTMLGATNPLQSNPGTIRGDYAIDIGRNIIHGSDSADAAKHEINFWFSDKELYDWSPSEAKWIYEQQ